MMYVNRLFLFIFILSISNSLFAQSEVNGGEFVTNKQSLPCLTESQREAIKIEINKNITILKSQNKLIEKTSSIVFFDWPIQASASSGFNEVWAISNYVDHNASFPNQILDYNCGSKSYDTNSGYNHSGIDMFTWPFSWYQLDNDVAEIVAAQDGQIVYKSDGHFDRSCGFNNNQWNAVYVRHSDNSTAWYGHMKNGSLTSKLVGDTVVKGEFLGVIGSSGNSTGPHLHFEVYDSSNNLIDPYAGDCNNLNADSWWNNQRPYVDPNINAVLTHSSPPVFNACSITETTNISDGFITNDLVIFAIYLRDQVAGTSINLKITKPDASIINWNFNLTDDFGVSYWYWQDNVDQTGTWKWEATYNGQTITHFFNVSSTVSVVSNTLVGTDIYPNPFSDIIKIKSEQKIVNVVVTDMLGKVIENVTSNHHISEIKLLNNVEKGLYFVSLRSVSNGKKTFKVVKD